MCQRVVRIHSHPSCLRFAVVIPRLYSDHYSDNNSECSALFWVGYKGQAEQQTPNNILHYYVSNVMLKFLNYYHCLYCNTDLRGASEEWVGAESPSLNPRSDPVHQRSTLLLKSTRHNTNRWFCFVQMQSWIWFYYRVTLNVKLFLTKHFRFE